MAILEISDPVKRRIDKLAKRHNLKIKDTTDAIFRWSLDKFEKGEAELTGPQVRETTEAS